MPTSNHISEPRGAVQGLNFVWDVGLLEWTPETQPGGSGGGGAVTVADGADVAQGSKADIAWVAGDGTVISLLKKIASAGGSAVSIADGSDVAEGTTTDVAVQGDNPGTVSAKLRGLNKSIAAGLPVTNAGLTNLDVALSTRTKPSDQQHVIVDSSAAIAVTGPLTDTELRASAVPVSASSLPLPVGAAQEEGGNLENISNRVAGLDNPAGGGYIRQDSTETIAKETGGNLSTIVDYTGATVEALISIFNSVEPFVEAAAGGYVRQDSTATIAKESGGNLAALNTSLSSVISAVQAPTIDAITVQTSGDAPLQVIIGNSSVLGGYIRQDSTATIAKETGGNLATLVTQTAPLITAQGATSTSVTGPMVQAAVSESVPMIYLDNTIQPLSLTSEGRLRVSNVPPNAISASMFFGDPDAYEFDTPVSTASPNFF